MERVMRLAFRI